MPPTDENELDYTYESRLKVLPSFGVLPVFGMLGGMFALDGISFNPMMLLHGEQTIDIHKPLPAKAEVTSTGRISDVFDKGKGALVIVTAETRDEEGDLLCTHRFLSFIRGEGGFGGDRGPSSSFAAPDRAPDHEVTYPTRTDQALLYRLSGDRNPLHRDPNVAKMAGFPRPILHGLCTYGTACRALISTVCKYDATKITGFDVRFSAPVLPGETIVTEMWLDGPVVSFRSKVKERDVVVLNNGKCTLAR